MAEKAEKQVIKTIYLVTHDSPQDIKDDGTWILDPGMTEAGRQSIASLLKHLTPLLYQGRPSEVHAGIGQRHFEVAAALGFTSDYHKSHTFYSALWGDNISPFLAGDQRYYLLGTGHVIDSQHLLTNTHLKRAIRETILSMPGLAVICGGRPILAMLGIPYSQCMSGALYALQICVDSEIVVKLIAKGENASQGD